MTQPKTPQRAWREVDLHALRRHFFLLCALCRAPHICPVLKANAYGHGAARLSPLYEAWGAHALAFATAEEAYEARRAPTRLPLFILGHTDPLFAPDLAAHGIIPTVHSPESARELSCAAKRAGVILPVQIKIDTGMGRIGFLARAGKEADCARAVLAAARLPNIRAVGIFTHFSSSDERGVGEAYTKEQLNRFLLARRSLFRAGLALPAHAANSAAALAFPAAHLDMIRPGLALYGIHPFLRDEGADVPDGPFLPHPFTVGRGPARNPQSTRVVLRGTSRAPAAPFSFTPALSVKATVTQVKWLKKGDAIGYGRAYIAPRRMRVATLSIGYADGLGRRQAACGGGVEVMPPKGAGKGSPVFLPFVGRISMDQCTVDASTAPFLRAGDAVTVLGGCGRVSFPEAALREGSIPYELLTRLSPRLPIVYTGK